MRSDQDEIYHRQDATICVGVGIALKEDFLKFMLQPPHGSYVRCRICGQHGIVADEGFREYWCDRLTLIRGR